MEGRQECMLSLEWVWVAVWGHWWGHPAPWLHVLYYHDSSHEWTEVEYMWFCAQCTSHTVMLFNVYNVNDHHSSTAHSPRDLSFTEHEWVGMYIWLFVLQGMGLWWYYILPLLVVIWGFASPDKHSWLFDVRNWCFASLSLVSKLPSWLSAKVLCLLKMRS